MWRRDTRKRRRLGRRGRSQQRKIWCVNETQGKDRISELHCKGIVQRAKEAEETGKNSLASVITVLYIFLFFLCILLFWRNMVSTDLVFPRVRRLPSTLPETASMPLPRIGACSSRDQTTLSPLRVLLRRHRRLLQVRHIHWQSMSRTLKPASESNKHLRSSVLGVAPSRTRSARLADGIGGSQGFLRMLRQSSDNLRCRAPSERKLRVNDLEFFSKDAQSY